MWFAPDGPTSRGSSPHTRGAQLQPAPRVHEGRIIPAYAGSTRRGSPRRRSPADHPRIRGEHAAAPGRANALVGIIPAYAGSTGTTPFPSARSWDHPRIRGEHDGSIWAYFSVPGSSPHTRGAPSRSPRWSTLGRIIPAYAGSTPDRGAESGSGRDHPRIRGEHGTNTAADYAAPGSSPHTRGARTLCLLSVRGLGIIPAYAGSTLYFDKPQTRNWDHPRIRGEHLTQARQAKSMSGSSPHTRGALVTIPNQVHPQGIIPAYAGSTP